MIYIFNDTADKATRDAETRLRAAQNEAEKQELTKLRDEAVINAKAVSFKNKHFKFLDRHIHYNISDDFAKDVKAVKETPVNGLIKLWLYQHGIIYRLTRPRPHLRNEPPIAHPTAAEEMDWNWPLC